MPHWSEVYPHDLHASAILKNNKIKIWKVGDGKLSEKYLIDSLIKEHPEYSYQEKTWTVNNDSEHGEVFGKLAPEWFSQWEHADDYRGFRAYNDINEEPA